MKIIIAIILVLLVITSYPSFEYQRAITGETALETKISGNEVANGETLLLEIIPSDTVLIENITSGLGDTSAVRLFDHPVEPGGAYFALIGINYYAQPYDDTLHVHWTESDMSFARSIPFSVVRGTYKSTRITGVPQSRVTPSAADYRRIARERREIAAAYKSVRDSVLMDGPFRMPTEKVNYRGIRVPACFQRPIAKCAFGVGYARL